MGGTRTGCWKALLSFIPPQGNNCNLYTTSFLVSLACFVVVVVWQCWDHTLFVDEMSCKFKLIWKITNALTGLIALEILNLHIYKLQCTYFVFYTCTL